MQSQLQDEIFSALHISKAHFLDEMGLLLIHQQVAEYKMEVDFFEKKYQQSFAEFDACFQQDMADLALEDDWLAWRFAWDSLGYWQGLLAQARQ